MLKKEFLLQNKESVINMYITENKTVNEVANAFNCSTAVLQRFLKEHGIRKKSRVLISDLPEKEKILKLIQEGFEYSNICSLYKINNEQLSKILEIGKFSNTINEDLINPANPLFQYLLGIISSDGHNGKYNSVDIFQKDASYLNALKKLLGHQGTLYKNSDGYILRINSKKLTNFLNSNLINSDKRYSVPYIKAESLDLEASFVRGLFDGDGCIYYNYVSGSIKNMRMEITTGSKNMIDGLKDLYNRLELHYTVDERISSAGNKYYVIYVRTYTDICKFGNFIYKDSSNFKLLTKYTKYLKFLNVIELDKKVDDIVGTY